MVSFPVLPAIVSLQSINGSRGIFIKKLGSLTVCDTHPKSACEASRVSRCNYLTTWSWIAQWWFSMHLQYDCFPLQEGHFHFEIPTTRLLYRLYRDDIWYIFFRVPSISIIQYSLSIYIYSIESILTGTLLLTNYRHCTLPHLAAANLCETWGHWSWVAREGEWKAIRSMGSMVYRYTQVGIYVDHARKFMENWISWGSWNHKSTPPFHWTQSLGPPRYSRGSERGRGHWRGLMEISDIFWLRGQTLA